MKRGHRTTAALLLPMHTVSEPSYGPYMDGRGKWSLTTGAQRGCALPAQLVVFFLCDKLNVAVGPL
jgi:hypothetical protein